MALILIVDDEPDIRELLAFNLKKAGYLVATADSGEAGIAILQSGVTVDLLVLDLMLPGIDGLTVCRNIKASDDNLPCIPIIMLTARGAESDLITGLEAGADDYLAKPFSPGVLTAKVKAVLRRFQTKHSSAAALSFGGLVIDPQSHEVRLDGKVLNLTLSEFNLLQCMSKNPDLVFSRSQLLDKMGGEDSFVLERNVDVHIASLRKKLGSSMYDTIKTVRGVGYKFKPLVDESKKS